MQLEPKKSYRAFSGNLALAVFALAFASALPHQGRANPVHLQELPITSTAAVSALVDPPLRDAMRNQQRAGHDPVIAELKVLLDRYGISPGAIDGKDTSYFRHALAAFEAKTGFSAVFTDSKLRAYLLEESGGPAFQEHAIKDADVAGPFAGDIPELIQEQADLPHLSYRNAAEMLAERFQMDEGFLRHLNPDADFSRPGSIIRVASPGKPLDIRIERVVASKSQRIVTGFGRDGEIIAVYPASIGSLDNPSPHGVFSVRNKAANPFYTLSADNTFEKVSISRNIRIAPGPNNPVGIAWIGLSEKGYGIHGTPEPSDIGLTSSHGCIRLTNWDAMELARLVRRGTEVVIE